MNQKKNARKRGHLIATNDDRAEDKNCFFMRCMKRKRVILGLVQVSISLTAVILFGISNVGESWAATNSMMMHNHVSLNVSVSGKPIIIPTHIGMTQTGIFADPLLYADHTLDKYGMEGMSPLHTHDSSGLIHIESNTVRTYTLGEFLNIWKSLNVDGKNVIASVDGNPVSDFRNVPLNDRARIVLDITS